MGEGIDRLEREHGTKINLVVLLKSSSQKSPAIEGRERKSW